MLRDWLCIGYDWAAETAKPIEMPFGRQSCVGSRTVCQMHVTLVPHGEYDRLIRVGCDAVYCCHYCSTVLFSDCHCQPFPQQWLLRTTLTDALLRLFETHYGKLSLILTLLLCTQLLYNLPLIIDDTSLLVNSGTNCLNVFQPIRILASTAAAATAALVK